MATTTKIEVGHKGTLHVMSPSKLESGTAEIEVFEVLTCGCCYVVGNPKFGGRYYAKYDSTDGMFKCGSKSPLGDLCI